MGATLLTRADTRNGSFSASLTLVAHLCKSAAMNGDAYMSTGEVARLLGMSVPTVNRRARVGDLPVQAKAPGTRGAYLFDRAAVEALAAERAK